MEISLSDLTQEQRRKLQEELKAKEQAEKEAYAREVETYRDMVSEAVTECFGRCKETSEMLARQKADIRDFFHDALELKAKLYGTKDGQQSHNFISRDGRYRIRLGYNVLDDYDDTAEAGVDMVKEYLEELRASGPSAQAAVDIAMSLLARDQKGNLKMSRIVTLRKHAQRSGNAKFIRGVDIIMDAYQPTKSKEFIRAEYKNEQGAWVNVPLGMTEA